MFITIKNTAALPSTVFAREIKKHAIDNIMSKGLRTAQILLDRHLAKQYSKGLKSCCYQLIEKCQCVGQSQITVVFKPKQLDDLATLITYGNGKVGGSSILRDAFTNFATAKDQQPDLTQAAEQPKTAQEDKT